MIISKTAYSNGFGTDRYKSCAGLTPAERTAVKNGEIVVFLCRKLSGGNHGHYLRVVTYKPQYGYNRRVATPTEIAQYNNLVRIHPQRD